MRDDRTKAEHRPLLERVDRWQRGWRWAAFPLAVVKKYGEDGAALNAARVSYYAFFSIFPLLLAFVSVLGFALQGNPELRQDIVESTFADVPVIGTFIRGDIGVITGSPAALVVGLGTALWAGLGVTVALGQAFDDVWCVPHMKQFGFLKRRLRGLAMLGVAGCGIVASSVLGGMATGGHLGATGENLAALVLSLAVDALALMAAFRLLTPSSASARELLPGVAVAVVGLLALQALGGWYIDAAVARASDTYGLFATVIGLLSWLSLAAHVVIGSAEVNAVGVMRLWPRSIRGPMTPADTRTLERYAERARHRPEERIMVRWPQRSAARPVAEGPPGKEDGDSTV